MTDRLIQIILSEQEGDGGFRNLRSPDPLLFSGAHIEQTTFITSQILLLAGSFLPLEAKAKAAAFLKRQIDPANATINYWPRGSVWAEQKPYPDDWDDTACGWLALASVGMALGGGDLAKLTASLIACESQPGGPYRTWLVQASAQPVWRDLDIAVNANIAAFLVTQSVSLNGLNQFLDAAIESGNCASPYYPDAVPVLYFLTRARGASKKEKLVSLWYRLRGANGWGDAMRDAMAASSLLRMGEPFDVQELFRRHELRPQAFCLDPAQSGQPTYAGSLGLTAAFVLEALHYSQQTPPKVQAPDPEEEILHQEILTKAASRCSDIPILQPQAAGFLKKLSEKDTKRQITLTPYRLAKALGRRDARDVALAAGVASVFGWAAYTLYDDVWDGDSGVSVLPLANLFHRRMIEAFTAVTADRVFQTWWQQVIDQIDEANAFELTHCRFTHEQGRVVLPAIPAGLEQALVGRSLGHVIGPGAILQLCGWPIDHPATLTLIEAYRAYILARQWHDDAHDWEGDFKRGQWNAASFEILKRWRGGAVVEMETFLKQGREIFWMEVIPEYTQRIIRVCEEAVESIKRIHDLKDPSALTVMFDVPLAGAKQALEERERTLSFLQSFPA